MAIVAVIIEPPITGSGDPGIEYTTVFLIVKIVVNKIQHYGEAFEESESVEQTVSVAVK